MDDQELHDLKMAEAKDRGLALPPAGQVQALLARKRGRSSGPGRSIGYDPLSQAMKDNPGLTYAEAEKMAAALGF